MSYFSIFFYLNCNKILFQVAFHNYKYLIKHISFKCCIIVSGCLLFGEENFPPIKYFDTPSSFINLLLSLYCYQIPQYSFKQRLEVFSLPQKTLVFYSDAEESLLLIGYFIPQVHCLFKSLHRIALGQWKLWICLGIRVHPMTNRQ